MSEAIYQVTQLGRQTSIGTAVSATTIFPTDAGWLGFELDRASVSPDEDYGRSSREQAGRESTGIRLATSTLPFVARYQDLFHAFEMHVAGTSGTASGTAAPYTRTYTFDETSDTLKYYTIEYGDRSSTQDEYRAYGVLANQFDFGFDALTAPGNTTWNGSLGLVAVSRDANAMTDALTAPTTLESLEGHLTTLQEGSTATAFASLGTATASLKQFSLSSTINVAGRAYGGATDKVSAMGRSGKGEVTFDALVAINSTTKTDLEDIFNVAGSTPTERRWRIKVTGSGNNSLTIDFRCRLRSVNRADQDGERLYAVNGVWVYDSTLAGRGQFTLVNDVQVIP